MIALHLPPDSGAGREPAPAGLGESPSPRAWWPSKKEGSSTGPVIPNTRGSLAVQWERDQEKPLDAEKDTAALARPPGLGPSIPILSPPVGNSFSELRGCENAPPLPLFVFFVFAERVKNVSRKVPRSSLAKKK